MRTYEVRRAPRHENVRLRGLDTHLIRWGAMPSQSEPPVVLLHGWQDTGETYQFMVDAFARDWPLVALDWRGFGRSEWPQDGYWFPDYFADLDALLDRVSPHAAVSLVGHSMGGNIALIYAGLRPERVRCVVSLEGFGLARTAPEQAPALLRKWLDQVKTEPKPKYYESIEQLAMVIKFRYPRFSEAQAAYVAFLWSQPEGERIRLLGDGRHRWPNPIRYQRDDAEACWREVRAPVLMLLGEESDYGQKFGADVLEESMKKIFQRVDMIGIAGAGHLLHIEKAGEVAHRVERFLSTV